MKKTVLQEIFNILFHIILIVSIYMWFCSLFPRWEDFATLLNTLSFSLIFFSGFFHHISYKYDSLREISTVILILHGITSAIFAVISDNGWVIIEIFVFAVLLILHFVSCGKFSGEIKIHEFSVKMEDGRYEQVTIKEKIPNSSNQIDVKTIIKKLVKSIFVLFLVLSISLFILGIIIVIDDVKTIDELKNYYRGSLPTEMASEELSEEIIDNIESENEIYVYLDPRWHADVNLASQRLVSQSDTDDYWIINDNPNLIYHLFYDSWDNVADEHIYIKNDYKYVDPETAKVTKICFGNADIDLSEHQINEIRDFIMGHNYDENKTQYYDKEYYEDEIELFIYWYFEGEDTLYYRCGELVKTKDGKYHLRAAPSYYTVYTLPDEICEKLDSLWQ